MIGAFLLALPVSFLPEPWREKHRLRLPLVAATGITGLAQMIVFATIWAVGLYRYATGMWPMFQDASFEATGSKNASGAVVWFLYVFSPLSIASGIGFFEGVVRVGAYWTDEACGSLVLWCAERAVRWRRERKATRKGPPPRDELTRLPDGRIRIASGDPFERWHDLMTVELDGAFYRVVSYDKLAGEEARPHIYVLEPVPESWTMRGLDKYAPPRPPLEKKSA